jgi:hypothetical protein
MERSVKNPCPIKTSRVAVVYMPECHGASEMEKWNYKDLPEDHPERIRIEKLFDTNKLPEKPNIPGKWRNER